MDELIAISVLFMLGILCYVGFWAAHARNNPKAAQACLTAMFIIYLILNAYSLVKIVFVK